MTMVHNDLADFIELARWIFSTVVVAAVAYGFNRWQEERKIKIEKTETIYRELNNLLHKFSELHNIPNNARILKYSDRESLEKIGELRLEIDNICIYIDFCLNSYLTPYDKFYSSQRFIKEYLTKREELSSLIVKGDIVSAEKRREYHDLFMDLKKNIENDIIELMRKIKIDSTNYFLSKYLLSRLKKIKDKISGLFSKALNC